RPPSGAGAPTGPSGVQAGAVLAVTGRAAGGAGWMMRWWMTRSILETMSASAGARPSSEDPLETTPGAAGLSPPARPHPLGPQDGAGQSPVWEQGPVARRVADIIDARRRLAGPILARAGLPVLTV